MFNPEMPQMEPEQEKMENRMAESSEVLEMEKKSTAWSGEAQVFTTVRGTDSGKYLVEFQCDDESKLPDSGGWLDLAPTTRSFDRFDEAVEYAKKALGDAESWQDLEEYN